MIDHCLHFVVLCGLGVFFWFWSCLSLCHVIGLFLTSSLFALDYFWLLIAKFVYGYVYNYPVLPILLWTLTTILTVYCQYSTPHLYPVSLSLSPAHSVHIFTICYNYRFTGNWVQRQRVTWPWWTTGNWVICPWGHVVQIWSEIIAKQEQKLLTHILEIQSDLSEELSWTGQVNKTKQVFERKFYQIILLFGRELGENVRKDRRGKENEKSYRGERGNS